MVWMNNCLSMFQFQILLPSRICPILPTTNVAGIGEAVIIELENETHEWHVEARSDEIDETQVHNQHVHCLGSQEGSLGDDPDHQNVARCGQDGGHAQDDGRHNIARQRERIFFGIGRASYYQGDVHFDNNQMELFLDLGREFVLSAGS